MTKRSVLTLMTAGLLSLPLQAAHAETSSSGLVQAADLVVVMHDLAPVIQQHRALKGFRQLSDSELRRAERGELVTREVPVPGSEVPRLTMATVMPYPIEALYLVLGDLTAHDEFIPQLDHSVMLSQKSQGMVREAFQFMGSPYPAQDRGWITRMENNKQLFEASGGRYWEVSWVLQGEAYANFVAGSGGGKLPKNLSVSDLESATTPNFGAGAFVLVPLGPSRTYVEYDSYTDPNANTIEKTLASTIGIKVQAGMFRSLEPLAKAWTEGRMSSTNVLVDMQGGSSGGLIERLKSLLSTSDSIGR